MKFQKPSLNFFLNGRKDERTNERTNAQAETNMLPHFFKVGGIKISINSNRHTKIKTINSILQQALSFCD